MKAPPKLPPLLKSKIDIRRILVPLDFSERSKMALHYALPFAEKWGATLQLEHVVPTLVGYQITPDLALEDAARAELEVFQEMELPRGASFKIRIGHGSPYREIIRHARSDKMDLIVCTTHGHTGLTRLFMGSTAERIVRHSPCPVLVIRARKPIKHAKSDRRKQVSHILFPTDFSKQSIKALQYAVALARAFHAKISMVHVVEPPLYGSQGGSQKYRDWEKTLRLNAAERMEHWKNRLGATSPLFKHFHIRTGDAFQEITREAESIKADLIAITTHGYTGIQHALLGSTTEKVVRHAHCPVLVVRSHAHDFVR